MDVKVTPNLPTEANAITKGFLEETLRAAEMRNDITVKHFSVSNALGKGENFGSIILRVKVISLQGEEEKEHSLFVKTTYDSEYMLQWHLLESKFEMKEIKAYSELLPSMIQFQYDQDVEPLIPSVPRYYNSCLNDKTGIIVIGDLTPEGYKMPDKRMGVDYLHSKLVMAELAKFHALSYAMKQANPKFIKERFSFVYHESFFNSFCKQMLNPSIKQNMTTTLQIVKARSHDVKLHNFVDKLLDLDVFEACQKFIQPEEPFSVVCHGDPWCNNMLFKYDKNDGTEIPVTIKLLDLQIIRYARPTTDLAYFFYTSTTHSMRKSHLNELLALYHKTFLETLKHVKSDAPGFTFDILQEMFQKTALFGVLQACIGLPFILKNKPENALDIEAGKTPEEMDILMEEHSNEVADNVQHNTVLIERLTGIMQEATDMGLL